MRLKNLGVTGSSVYIPDIRDDRLRLGDQGKMTSSVDVGDAVRTYIPNDGQIYTIPDNGSVLTSARSGAIKALADAGYLQIIEAPEADAVIGPTAPTEGNYFGRLWIDTSDNAGAGSVLRVHTPTSDMGPPAEWPAVNNVGHLTL